jgi:hypothetical protein
MTQLANRRLEMKLIRLILPALLLANAGVAQEVWSKYSPDATFSQYKTYKWVQIEKTAQLDPLTEQQLKAATDSELAKKGLLKIEGGEADLLVGYQVTFRKSMEWSSFTEMPGPGVIVAEGGARWNSDYRFTRPLGTTTATDTLHVGDYGLDVYDAAHKKLIWRGDATKTLEAGASSGKRKKNIEKGVAKLLKDFPPKNTK